MKTPGQDPLTQFRKRILALILGLILFLVVVQLLNNLLHPKSNNWIYGILMSIVVLSLICIQHLQRIEGFASFSLIGIVMLATGLEITAGRHPFSPLVVWTSFAVFASYLVNGRSLGRKIMVLSYLVITLLACLPWLIGVDDYPMQATANSFQGRVSIVIIMSFILLWLMTFLFENFLHKSREEMQKIQSVVEKQRSKALLKHFTNRITEDLLGPVHRLEELVTTVHDVEFTHGNEGLEPVILEARQCIDRLESITERYRQLSLPSQLVNGQGMKLGQFLDSIQTFSLGSSWTIHGSLDPGMHLRGDHVVTLQLILCLALMNAQSSERPIPSELAVTQKNQEICFTFPFYMNGSLPEIQQMLQDMHGSIQQLDGTLYLCVPLSSIS